VDVEVTTEKENYEVGFGDKITISYFIKNNSKIILNISSMELKLPKILRFIEMDSGSGTKSVPVMVKGIFIWAGGPYLVEPGKQYILSFLCKANAKAVGEIDFSITTGGMYEQGPKIKVIVK
jgi:hypothetical protein